MARNGLAAFCGQLCLISPYHRKHQNQAVSSHAEGMTIDQLLAHRKQHDPERYGKMTMVQGYTADLDLAVLDPDGVVASYCICWYDPDSRSGLFEPVGTLSAYRRRGLAHVLLGEGVRRLRDRGAQRIFVCTAEANEPAVRLYRSAGFVGIARDQTWAKQIGPQRGRV